MQCSNFLALSSLLSIVITSSVFAGENNSTLGDWKKVADSVYEQTDANGTVTRMAYGASGARYDRSVLSAKIGQLANKVANGSATDDEKDSLQELQGALAGISTGTAKEGGSVQPMDSQSGLLCNVLRYDFDSHFTVGLTGATPISRAALSTRLPGPPPISVNAATIYTNSSVTPTGLSPISVTKTATLASTTPLSAIADWGKNPIGTYSAVATTDCKASTYSYIQVSVTGPCTGIGSFASLTKSYTQCVNSP